MNTRTEFSVLQDAARSEAASRTGTAAGRGVTDSALTDLSPLRLRSIMGSFGSGVTVITSATPDGPAGFTCQSFTSLSLEPALVTFNPARSSSTWPRIREIGSFTVNVLGADQQALSGQFARSGTDKFAGVDWTESPFGNPILPGAVTWIDCTLHAEYDGGDHTIVVGAVHALASNDEAEPLLFVRGSYRGLQPLTEAAVSR